MYIKLSAFLTSLWILSFVGCGAQQTHDRSTSDLFVAVEDTAKDSKTVDKEELGLKGAKNFHIGIDKAAFGQDFLLSMSYIPQRAAATSTGLASKVVRFEKWGDVVDMYESNAGNIVTTSLPAKTLLAQFPVINQTETQVVIDFDKGMKDVYQGVWYQQSNTFSESDTTADIRTSRIFEVTAMDDLLLIKHALMARMNSQQSGSNVPMEIRYYLRRYQESRFPVKEIGNLKHVGFFGVPSKLELNSGRNVNPTIRFDISKPVKFYFSSNTPDEYVEAVKDGVLYWNKAFGRDVVTVAKAPEGVTAPDPRHNVIQWVEYDNAGFAYADVLADPITGQAMHGQVYLTSVFGFASKTRARKLLRQLSLKVEKKDSPKKAFLFPNFARPVISCNHYSSHQFATHLKASLEEVLANENATDEAVLRISQDYVREVVGHEVGHVLGLRHNFAASAGGNMTPKEKKEWMDAYIRGEAEIDEEKVAVTSLMEYSVPVDAYYNGFFMRKAKKALPYDEAAIRWGYFDDERVKDEKFIFCTDDHHGRYNDCLTFDEGPSVADTTIQAISDSVRNLPASILETYIANISYPDPALRRSVKEVSLNSLGTAARVVAPIGSFLKALDSGNKLIAVDRTFDAVGPLMQEDVLNKRWEMINKEIENAGGIDQVLFAILPEKLSLTLTTKPKNASAIEKLSAETLKKRFKSLLESPAYTEFYGADGKKHSFTAEDKTHMTKMAFKVFDRLEKDVVKAFLATVKDAKVDLGTAVHDGLVQDDDVANKIQKILTELIATVVLTKDSESDKILGKLGKAGVWVSPFKYDIVTRNLAAGTFSSFKGNYAGWSDNAISVIGAKFKAEVHTQLNIANMKEFKSSLMSPSIAQWYRNQKSVAAKLKTAL